MKAVIGAPLGVIIQNALCSTPVAGFTEGRNTDDLFPGVRKGLYSQLSQFIASLESGHPIDMMQFCLWTNRVCSIHSLPSS